MESHIVSEPRTTILIIDDNPTNLGVVADYLRQHQFEIMIASSGELGLKRVKYSRPNLILLDVMMPDMDGFEVCRRLKADETTRDIPVIFMTALTNVEDKVTGFEVGGVDYITKPIQHEEVLARVSTHLRIYDLTRKLQLANQELRKANADKNKFFSIVAHDLRSPFTPLLGNAELLSLMSDTLPPPEVKKMSDSIYRAGKQILELLQSLLEWGQLEIGRMEFHPVTFDLGELSTDTVQLLSSIAFSKQITLRNNILPQTRVYGDKNMLSTVLRNLVSNAIKFTLANGQVTLSATVIKNWLEVAVTDTGLGMNEADVAKLLRLDIHHSTLGTEKEQGTGLGLIICQDMVEKHGGRIWVESELGQGTTVKFTVPFKAV